MPVQDRIPRSRVTLTYRTEIRGEPADVTLPFRLLVMGDFSYISREGGSPTPDESLERQKDLEDRPIRSINPGNPIRSLNGIIEDMGIKLKFSVPNRITGSADDDMLPVTIPITNLKSFDPGEVAQHVDSVRALLAMRSLLLELQADVANNAKLRKALKEIMRDAARRNALTAELGASAYQTMRLPAPASNPDPAQNAAPAPANGASAPNHQAATGTPASTPAAGAAPSKPATGTTKGDTAPPSAPTSGPTKE